MSSRDDMTLPAARPRSRKSLAHVPSSSTGMDKENITADIGAMVGSNKRAPPIAGKAAKKSRSKSIGPGGLDALMSSSGNRRKSIAAPPPRSILKPTIAPLQEIPARKPSPKKSGQQAPAQPSSLRDAANDDTADPFTLPESTAACDNKVTLRTEEEQQAAARKRDGDEAQDKEDLAARRAARRKSLASRRVSFAPEATLHTWDVVDYMQDSTTSSDSTNSTRRTSSASNATIGSQAGPFGSEPSEPPSTPPEQVEDRVSETPDDQRALHQKKRRRSSGIPPLNFNNPDDEFFSSSPSEGSSVVEDANENFNEDGSSDSNSDSDDDGTAMSIDMGEGTDMSMASVKSFASDGSSVRLERALQLAAQQAGTQGIDFDENGPLGIEEDEDVVASFAPWSQKSATANLESQTDQENVNPFSPAFAVAGTRQQNEDDEDDGMTMEMTRSVGGILQAPESQLSDDDDQSMDITMDMTRAVGRIMPAEQSDDEDGTMEMTKAVGHIFSAPVHDSSPQESDDEMTMDMTVAIGGIIGQDAQPKNRRQSVHSTRRRSTRRRSSVEDSSLGDETMDFTVAMGGIQPAQPATPKTAPLYPDMKAAFNEIVAQPPSSISRPEAKRILVEEVDHAEVDSSPFQPDVPAIQNPVPIATTASETGSPGVNAFRGKGLRRSSGLRTSVTPKPSSATPNSMKLAATPSPLQKPTTPSKQATPQPGRPTTPGKTPPSKSVAMRTGSPQRLFEKEIKAANASPRFTPSKKPTTPNRLFQRNVDNNTATPSIILKPQSRRSSGVGIDRPGLGSPRVAAILDRRGSIGDQASSFHPSRMGDAARVIRFNDAEIIEHEVDREREEERDREDGRKVMEREADLVDDEKDATINLKEMIQSLTPKKRPLKGRKSLHIGAAKGILGKRPAELDDDDENGDDDEGGTKRLKNFEGSPVKNVKLRAPPSKEETTGRLTRAVRRSLESTSGNASTPTTASSPAKVATATTPKGQARFKDAEAIVGADSAIPFEANSTSNNPITMDENDVEDRIQLQDFLNLTSIRFMELTTTKRRHTIAPNAAAQDGSEDQIRKDDGSLENCVVSAACTLPMLELFQHSCRELKKYISEGRKMVREIETETFDENPPLFQEYISATPDVKKLMDSQFRNIKTHSRLVSKGMWYEWRMKLLDGLRDGLITIAEGMTSDADVLAKQQELLDDVVSELVQKYETLLQQEADLQTSAEEIANCNQEDLAEARECLVALDADIESKKALVQELRSQMEDNETRFKIATERKQACLDEIREADKIREECRGWTGSEIAALKAKADALEEKYGWTITGISGTTLSLSLRSDLELVFDASSFRTKDGQTNNLQAANSRIDLWYIAANRERNPLPLTPEKAFFVESIRDGIRGMPQSQTTIKELLDTVSFGWATSLNVVEEIEALNRVYPTDIAKTSDESIVIKSKMLLASLASKVEVSYHVTTKNGEEGLEVQFNTTARVVYGERFNEDSMGRFLGKGITEGRSWVEVVKELEGRLFARGKK
ncbi:hypothetical protein V495_02919 [Pseudogymnoascus sp. VKM F-4514 (FW-929)]|nr:hypothetical protein V495_02919 [Pseudogymnoascus sp. VKM F-4514 (FW-929)]KFY61153.1 hypothetical protein V497_03099 [Pseudogymnoascus sp. VKM F-4516 (FW-969)]